MMQANQHFVENLITLRNHYQALLEEYERSWVQVREQLTHLNALLVDQLVQNQQHFVESLIGLRDQYQAQMEEYSRSSSHAREQLTHVNALLVDQLVLPDGQQPVSIQASTVESLQPNHPFIRGRGGSVGSFSEAIALEKHPITPSLDNEQSRQGDVNENEASTQLEAAEIPRDSSPEQDAQQDYDQELDIDYSTIGQMKRKPLLSKLTKSNPQVVASQVLTRVNSLP